MVATGYEWDDEQFLTAGPSFQGWYRGVPGFKDVVRIVDKAYVIAAHRFSSNGRFTTVHCSKVTSKTCPYCTHADTLAEHRMATVFGTILFHIVRKSSETKGIEKIYALRAWRFGKDKKGPLAEINELTGGKLMKTDLLLKLQDNSADAKKYQKMVIQHMPNNLFDPKKIPDEMKAQVKAELSKENLEKIRALLFPTAEVLEAQFKQFESASSFDEDASSSSTDSFFEEEKSESDEGDEDVFGF